MKEELYSQYRKFRTIKDSELLKYQEIGLKYFSFKDIVTKEQLSKELNSIIKKAARNNEISLKDKEELARFKETVITALYDRGYIKSLFLNKRIFSEKFKEYLKENDPTLYRAFSTAFRE